MRRSGRRTTPKADPLGIARGLLKHDLGRIWEEQYRGKFARGLSLDEFFGLTAAQLFRTFFREKPDPNRPPPEIDNVAFLRKINQHRASQGLPPATPDWFLKEVPRHG